MRILVTGSRAWPISRAGAVTLALWQQLPAAPTGPTVTLVVGDCPTGVDMIVADFWRREMAGAPDINPHPEVHRADWHTHGRAAGPLRNQAMVDAGADLCLAFPFGRSAGTWDCVRRAKAAGIQVVVHEAVRGA